jgi:HK97 family phage prohead protease
MTNIEQRSIAAELRAGDSLQIAGSAVPYGKLSNDLGGFREQFSQGAFAETLADPNNEVWLLWAHNLAQPLAARKAGTLQLFDEQAGLRFDAKMNNTTWSRDAYEAIRSRSVSGVSFRFTVPKGGDSLARANGELVRIVHRANLLEISPTPLPAYPQTAVGVRSAAEVLASFREPGMVERDLLAQLIELERMH